ncbi:MAG: 3-keto-5-aminohexanoate cleavage protein [Kouleothrix sp.]|nr:3-keto-5-aminohexanoate cleavage protein [Kouleothrix sp.]
MQLTTGGSPLLSVEERLNTVLLGPEMCSLNMGLLNFSFVASGSFSAIIAKISSASRARCSAVGYGRSSSCIPWPCSRRPNT